MHDAVELQFLGNYFEGNRTLVIACAFMGASHHLLEYVIVHLIDMIGELREWFCDRMVLLLGFPPWVWVAVFWYAAFFDDVPPHPHTLSQNMSGFLWRSRS